MQVSAPQSYWPPLEGSAVARPPGRGAAFCSVHIVNLSRGGILLPSVARRFGAEKSLARL